MVDSVRTLGLTTTIAVGNDRYMYFYQIQYSFSNTYPMIMHGSLETDELRLVVT